MPSSLCPLATLAAPGPRGAGLGSAVLLVILSCVVPGQPLEPAQLSARISPSVVRVEAAFPDGPALGLGFAIAADRIATDLELVDGASRVSVLLADGRRLAVRRVIGLDEAHGAIVLGTDDASLRALGLVDDAELEPGAAVYAVGSARPGEAYRILEGSLRERRRPSGSTVELLGLWMELEPGWSGAPLLDVRGRVLGMATRTRDAGPALAIPSRALRPLGVAAGRGVRFEDFAVERGAEIDRSAAREGSAPSGPVVRAIPEHATALIADCPDAALDALVQGIGAAIREGAPVYNQGDAEGCFRIYADAAERLAADLGAVCPGAARALRAGLSRAGGEFYYRSRAWALRDAFDGLLRVISRSR